MTIGGLKFDPNQRSSSVKAYGVEVPEFIGCIRRFILNNEAQPLTTGTSGFLKAELIGQVSQGCSGPLGCVSPPCTLSPLGKNSGLSAGVIIMLIFFAILFVILFVAGFVLRRIRGKRQGVKTAADIDIQRSKLSNLAIISQGGLNGSNNSIKADSGLGSRDLAFLNHSQNNLSLAFSQQRTRPPSSTSGAPPPYGVHVGSGAYQNQLDMLQDERSVSQSLSPERYDLDNASSIAPSDIEVSYHYRGYRDGGSSKRKQPLTNPQLAKIRNNNAHGLNNQNDLFKTSQSSVKQLRAALRASPASIGTGQGCSSEEGAASSQKQLQVSRRPGSAHSGRSKRRRDGASSSANASRSSSRGKGSLKRTPRGAKQQQNDSSGNILSVKDLRRYNSSNFEEDASSSSSSSEQPPVPPMRRFPPSAPRILSRSPHAPPLKDTSTDESDRDSVAFSELDLDKVRKPRRLLSMPDDTETESEAGTAFGTVPSSLAPFRPPRSMFPVSEDESDAPTASVPIEMGSASSNSAFRPIPKRSLPQGHSEKSNRYGNESQSSGDSRGRMKAGKDPNLEAYV